MKNNILGALYGMAIGDAMGMPSELWGRNKVKAFFGTITEFLDGPQENDVACNFTRGQFTDDTSQTLLILDALIETGFVPDPQVIGRHLLAWADRLQAFDNNILGPSSKAALLALKDGQDVTPFTSKAETNGAAMRIAPVGCLFPSAEREKLAQFVFDISRVTHSTDVAVGGAAMIAAAVSSAMEDKPWDAIMDDAIAAYHTAKSHGAETYSASLSERLELAIEYARKLEGQDDRFLQRIYDVIGSGVITSESVPAALAIAYYAKEPQRCSLLCANLGGDTDTIGAMATAICGAKAGADAIDPAWRQLMDEANGVDFEAYADRMLAFRNQA
ncbi:ADP-ribosylglycohydrolase family protein [Paenibacillus sp. LHD-117]|uniref:ADP-ribosylglycohydrolase family protein n=1 Tax=Paenibacillus sp. LHD-117 TaxID=3071412 RepID=UPI0027E009A7|nr:ADP-ribosylglycohydrolase family protein [Paenibacillus sp. LHD-117]MDQ6423140.1 ADP-ribosylglycohydrolase family protein [Paenibacillus sp. LHD-117]